MKSLLAGWTGSVGFGFRGLFLAPLTGFSRLYSQMELAPHEYNDCTMVSCSGIQAEPLSDLTCEMCLPNDRWMLQHWEQMRIPRLIDAQVGFEALQSAQTESGCRWDSPRLLDFEDSIFSSFSVIGWRARNNGKAAHLPEWVQRWERKVELESKRLK